MDRSDIVPHRISLTPCRLGRNLRLKIYKKPFLVLCTPLYVPKLLVHQVYNTVRSFLLNALTFYLILVFSVYYRIYDKEGAITTKRPAYLDDSYLGRIKSKWVAPPYNASSLRRCLSSMENIDSSKTRLFATPSSKAALVDDIPVSLKSNQTLGVIPEEPLALISEAMAKDGMTPGTESLRVLPDAQSPLTPRFCKSLLVCGFSVSNETVIHQSQYTMALIPKVVLLHRRRLLTLRNPGFRELILILSHLHSPWPP